MRRRQFVNTAMIGAALPIATQLTGGGLAVEPNSNEKQLIEIRVYELKFGTSAAVFIEYIKNGLALALKRAGAASFRIFKEYGLSDPGKLWLVIGYPNMAAYVKAQQAYKDESLNDFQAAARQAIHYSRYDSWLLHAFDGFPTISDPQQNDGLFELRIYEGINEEAVRRKISMFDTEEIELFHKVGLHPFFFGEMIAGPYRPSLVYALHFKDMNQRDANWQVFIQHPEWKIMVAKEEYANTVSNIIRVFLVPL